VLLALPVLGAVCGYVSRTTSSLAYVAPLNLLVLPAFFFADASVVIGVMLALSALATAGLWAGSALRGAAGDAASQVQRAARGSLRYTLSGLAIDEATAKRLPVDGRSNLTGGAG